MALFLFFFFALSFSSTTVTNEPDLKPDACQFRRVWGFYFRHIRYHRRSTINNSSLSRWWWWSRWWYWEWRRWLPPIMGENPSQSANLHQQRRNGRAIGRVLLIFCFCSLLSAVVNCLVLKIEFVRCCRCLFSAHRTVPYQRKRKNDYDDGIYAGLSSIRWRPALLRVQLFFIFCFAWKFAVCHFGFVGT